MIPLSLPKSSDLRLEILGQTKLIFWLACAPASEKKVRVYIFYLDILLFSAHEHFLFLSPSRIFFYSLFPINLCETLFSFHLLARPHSIHPLLKVKVLRCSIVHEPSLLLNKLRHQTDFLRLQPYKWIFMASISSVS